MLFGQSRFERGNSAATAMLITSVLASVGCDRVESPFAPDFGVAEPAQLAVSAEPPSVEEPPAAGIDIPSDPEDETADASATPAEDQPKSAPLISKVSIRPLIVIDGVVQPEDFRLRDVARVDIDHVEMVRGPAATILYGPRARARGGVIEIRTKPGTQATILNGLKPR